MLVKLMVIPYSFILISPFINVHCLVYTVSRNSGFLIELYLFSLILYLIIYLCSQVNEILFHYKY